jgi:hypothetical protein
MQSPRVISIQSERAFYVENLSRCIDIGYEATTAMTRKIVFIVHLCSSDFESAA